MSLSSAPGNLFFLGEHSVVYGYPAINVSVNRRTYTHVEKRNDDLVRIFSEVFGETIAENNGGLEKKKTDNKELVPLMEFTDFIIREFGIRGGFNLEIRSEIPVESGMSSSTAVMASMLSAISSLYGHDIEKGKYFDFIYPFQVKIHGGKASGSEIISSSLGGFNKVRKTDTCTGASIKWDSLGTHKLYVVVGNTRVRAPTSLTVGMHIPSLMKRNRDMVEKSFSRIGELVEKAETAIRAEDEHGLGELMNENQRILSGLMLSHPKLDDCIREALDAGALGAKLSGGGWGGVMFALVNEENREKVARAIKSTGSEAIITEIGVEGVVSKD